MRESAGILLYRIERGELEVLLVHPGGPFWARRDEGAWTIPKGEVGDGETPITAACREFREETGAMIEGPFALLPPVRQAGGKRVHAFAVRGAFDPRRLVSSTFEIEWPPRSGRRARFPEVDRAAWFTQAEAASKLNPAQRAWLEPLRALAVQDT